MKNKQNYAVFTILLSIVITSCTANDKPFDSASETQTGEAVTAAVSTAEKIDSATETEKSISDTEVQTVPITETEAVTESMEKLDWVCGKTVQEERNFDTILKEDYDTPTVTWSSDERYAVVTESSKDSGEITIFDTLTNTMTSMPRLEIQNRIHGEVPDYVNLYCCDLLSYEWETDSILNVQFDMKTGVSFYHQSNMGWYTYDLTNGSITAFSYDIAIPEPIVNTMIEEEIKAVIDENLDILINNIEEWSPYHTNLEEPPNAFKEIVALGENALLYLNEISMNIHNKSVDSRLPIFALMAAYAIKPELYEPSYISPDGKYECTLDIESFAFATLVEEYYHERTGSKKIRVMTPVFNLLRVKDCETDSIVMIIDNVYIPPMYIHWSDNSRYAEIFTGDKYFSDVEVLDVQKKCIIKLPEEDDILNWINYELDEQLYVNWSEKYTIGWESAYQIIICIPMDIAERGSDKVKEKIIAQYIYNLDAREIIEVEIDKYI